MRLRADLRFIVLLLFLPLFAGVVLLSGCGGGGTTDSTTNGSGNNGGDNSGNNGGNNGGGTPTPTVARARFPIVWGPRSRQTSTTNQIGGLSSALSAVITLNKPSDNAEVVRVTANRTVQSGPENYTAANDVEIGTYVLTAVFYAQANGTGAVVGIAQASASLLADGTINTTISTTGTIRSVDTLDNQLILIGDTIRVGYTAYSTTTPNPANVIAVTPGSAFVTVVSGTDKLTADGEMITGVAPNRATIRVALDNFVSPVRTVIVRARTSVAISPVSAEVSLAQTQQFSATLTNDGPSGKNGVTWELSNANAGTLTVDPATPNTVTFTASTNISNEATYTLTARSVYDSDIVAQIPLVVKSSLTVTTNVTTASVSLGLSRTFSATVTKDAPVGSSLRGVTWALSDAKAGAIVVDPANPNQVTFTATLNPANEGTYAITARSILDNRVVATIALTVQSAVAVTVTPDPGAQMSIRANQQFTATVSNVPTGSPTGVTWSVVTTGGGTITATGLYTAPATPGTYTIRATSVFDTRKFKDVQVVVSSGGAGITIR